MARPLGTETLTHCGARYDTSVQASSQNKRRDLKGLATITLRLMQKYVLEDGSIGVDKQEYWRQSQILEFLSSTKSADGPGELRKVRLVDTHTSSHSPYFLTSLASFP